MNFNKAVLCILISVIFLSQTSVISTYNEQPFLCQDLICDVVQIDNQTISFSVVIPDLVFSQKSLLDSMFTVPLLDGSGMSSTIGQAGLPIIRRVIEIPFDTKPEISIEDIVTDHIHLSDLYLSDQIYPVQPPVTKGESENVVIDEDFYSSDKFFPAESITIDSMGMIRGRRYAVVEIAPVQYNPVKGIIQKILSVDFIVHFDQLDMSKTVSSIESFSSSGFEVLFETTFENYGYYEGFADRMRSDEGFLFIVHDGFYNETIPLLSWKETMGYQAMLVNVSDIPGSGSAEDIHLYVKDIYENGSLPPTYLLLVGDTGFIPHFIGDASSTATDTYYGCMDDDIFPDIFVGRLPAANLSQLQVMVDKIMFYESGEFASREWITHAVFMAGNDHHYVTEETHNHVIATYLNAEGYSSEKLYEESFGAISQDISDEINEGVSIAVFSGHGSSFSWVDGPSFHQSNVRSLTNQGMYPFVCSHACKTGRYSDPECFAETWLRVENKGALAFWGSSHDTFWDEDDIIERKMFHAWWNLSLHRIGQMTSKALYDAFQYYGPGGGMMDIFIESYNVLGDPSVRLWSSRLMGNVNQSSFDRGFPIRHAVDGDWAGAQSVSHAINTISSVDLYLRKFGNPEFDLVVELRMNGPDGPLLDSVSFTPNMVPSSWEWFPVDFVDMEISAENDTFIMIPPAPSGVSTSFGYEWGYAFGNQYDEGSFWFTRDGGDLWRDLPSMYEFVFKTHGF